MPNGVIGEKKEFILLGDLNYDLLSETISKSKHLVRIYNIYVLPQVLKEATRTAAETTTLACYIVTNNKDKIADSGIVSCGIIDHHLFHIIRHARLPQGGGASPYRLFPCCAKTIYSTLMKLSAF